MAVEASIERRAGYTAGTLNIRPTGVEPWADGHLSWAQLAEPGYGVNMRYLDFSSWQASIPAVIGLVVATFVMVGIRLLVMESVQRRRQRENRQINERLRTLIAAYKTLGGSFTGDLAVDPTHLREVLGRRVPPAAVDAAELDEDAESASSSDRSRRIRDAVEAALSDVILLGNEEQVRLAAGAATELAAGRPVHTDALVVSLRDFIRKVLDLEAVPAELAIPKQGPTRPGSGAGGGRRSGAAGGDRTGRGGGMGGGMAGGGMVVGLGGLADGQSDSISRQG